MVETKKAPVDEEEDVVADATEPPPRKAEAEASAASSDELLADANGGDKNGGGNGKAKDAPVGAPAAVPDAGGPKPDVKVVAEKTPEQLREARIEELRSKNPALAPADLKRANYLQDTLSNLAGLYTTVERSGKPSKQKEDDQALKDAVKKQQDALALEREAGVFGPATQEAYKKYVDWLQSRAIPGAVRELDSCKLPIPPGCPMSLPKDQYERSINPDLYRALASSGQLTLDLNLKPGEVPDERSLVKLDKAYNWLGASSDYLKDYRLQGQERALTGLIDSLGLPQTWKRQEGQDRQQWVQSAADMADLAVRTRNYVEAMQSLYKKSNKADFPLHFPEGTKLTVELNGTKHQLTEKDVQSGEGRRIFREGTITRVGLDLPDDLRQAHAKNEPKVERLRAWLAEHGKEIEQAKEALVDLQSNPDAAVMYGDQEVLNGKGLFNAKNEFLGVVNDKYQAKPGESVRPMNLIGYDFNADTMTEGEHKGKIRLSQNIQAENAPWYAYQNLRFLGVDKVGAPMPGVGERYVDPESWVGVRNGDKFEIIKAKHLSEFKSMQQFAYWGEKGLVATMDVALLATSFTGIGATLKGAQLATTGASAALRLTGMEAAWELTKHGTRAVVAGLGILNNAGGRSLMLGDVPIGQHINTGRGLFFLADTGVGLARGGWGLFKAAKASETLTAAEKVHTLLHGKKAVEGAEALKGIPWLKQIDSTAQVAFKATELIYAPVIATELHHQIKKIQELGKRDPALDAIMQVGDGRGMQAPGDKAFDPTNAKQLEATKKLLDGYSAALGDKRSPDTQAKVAEIFKKTQDLLTGTPEQKAAYRKELMEGIGFTGEQIRQLEAAHPSASEPSFQLTAQQINDLRDPAKRQTFPKNVQEMAEKFLAEKDKDVEAASRIALLYLARDGKGGVSEEVGTASAEVPKYTRKVITGHDSEGAAIWEDKTFEAHSVTQNIAAKQAVEFLKRDLESPNLGNRGIVTGDALLRVGAITHQAYAGVLQDVLNDKNASREDKLRAMADPQGARLATIIDGIKKQESQAPADQLAHEKGRSDGRSFGLTSKDLMETLQKTAADKTQDADVRSMAAALLYAMKEPDQKRRADLLASFNDLKEQNLGTKGALATKVTEFLQKEMQTAIPAEEEVLADYVRGRRLDAAQLLSSVADTSATPDLQLKISRAIANSFSTTSGDVAIKALELMTPERFDQLYKSPADKALAIGFQEAAVSMVKSPRSKEEAESLVKILGYMRPLLDLDKSTLALRQQLEKQLLPMLDSSRMNKEYAEQFPQVRVAAIDTLAKFGSQNSLDIIRSHVSALPQIKVDGRPAGIDAGETDASVRLAAIKALEKLNDVQLRTYIGSLIASESDPQVASKLRDVHFFQERLEPSSVEWKDMFEKWKTALVDPMGEAKYPHLKDMSDKDCIDFLNTNFPKLNRNNFVEASEKAMKDSTSWIGRRARATVTFSNDWTRAYENIAQADVANARSAEWTKLKELALGEGKESEKARKALYYVMMNNGGPFGDTSDTVNSNGNYAERKDYNPDYRLRAARVLAEACKAGYGSRDATGQYVRVGLEHAANLPGEVKLALLEGLKELAKPGPNGDQGMSKAQAAKIAIQALETEVDSRTTKQQDKSYQIALLKVLDDLQYRKIFPALEAVAQNSTFPEVSTEARRVLTRLRDSTNLMYEQTPDNTTSSKEARAERVRTSLKESSNAEDTVQEIFNMYKGYNDGKGIKDADDPGIAQLQVALMDKNERVRLAAARILMDSQLPNNNVAKSTAITMLADMAAGGSIKAYRDDAYQQLNKLQIKDPLLLMIGNPEAGKAIKVEKVGDQIKATEFTGGRPSGYLYPGGGSMRWKTDEQGNVSEVTENGVKLEGAQLLKKTQGIIEDRFLMDLAGATSPEEKVSALRNNTRPPITAGDDRRIEKVVALLKDGDESVRLEAAATILRRAGNGQLNSGFTEAQRQAALQEGQKINAAEHLTVQAMKDKNPSAVDLLDAMIALKDKGATSAAIDYLSQRRENWQAASALLEKHLGAEKYVETLPNKEIRTTYKIPEGIVTTDRAPNGNLTRVITPDKVKYADLVMADMAKPERKPDEKVALARDILTSPVAIGATAAQRVQSLEELAKVASDKSKTTTTSTCLSAARLLMEVGASNSPEKARARELIMGLDKDVAIPAMNSLARQIRESQNETEKAQKLDLFYMMAEKWKGEPGGEAAIYDLFANNGKDIAVKEDDPIAQKLMALVDRTKADHNLSAITSSTDPRISAMASMVATPGKWDIANSAALALIDTRNTNVSASAQEEARKHLYHTVKEQVEDLRAKETEADVDKAKLLAGWEKVDLLMERMGASKDDYSRLHIESKRLEAKGDYKQLAAVYEKLAAIAEKRGSTEGAEIYKGKARDALELASPEIIKARDEFNAALKNAKDMRATKVGGAIVPAEAKLENAIRALSKSAGEDSQVVLDAYLSLAKYYKDNGKEEKAQAASALASGILQAQAQKAITHIRPGGFVPADAGNGAAGGNDPNAAGGNGGAPLVPLPKRLATGSEGFGGTNVALSTNDMMRDMLDFQVSKAAVIEGPTVDAQQKAAKAFKLQTDTFGAESPEGAKAKEAYADIMTKTGKGADAALLYDEAVRTSEMFLDPTNPQAHLKLVQKLAQAKINQGGMQGPTEAANVVEDALDRMRATGANPQVVANQMLEYAKTFRMRGDDQKASELMMRAKNLAETGFLSPGSRTSGMYTGFRDSPGFNPGGPGMNPGPGPGPGP